MSEFLVAQEAAEASGGFSGEIAIGIGGLVVGALAILSTWWQGRRQDKRHAAQLTSEEKRHSERLRSEETRHAARIESDERLPREPLLAAAYAKAVVALLELDLERVEVWVATGHDRMPPETFESVFSARVALFEVKASGWDPEVKKAAQNANTALSMLANRSFGLMHALRRGSGDRASGQYDDAWDRTYDRIERLVEAVDPEWARLTREGETAQDEETPEERGSADDR